MSEKDLEDLLSRAYSAKPRPGFERELWQRLQVAKPWWRQVPALAGAAAVMLVVAGMGVYVASGFGPGSTMHGGGSEVRSEYAPVPPTQGTYSISGPYASGSNLSPGSSVQGPPSPAPAPACTGKKPHPC